MSKEIAHGQILWTQDWGTYEDHTVVCVGFESRQELVDLMIKDKCLEWAEAIRVREDFDDMKTSNFFSKWEYKDCHYSILWLLDWKRDMKHYSILAHELVHAVSFMLGKRMDIEKENEAVAYQHTYLFRKIATQLDGWVSRKKTSLRPK